MRRFWIVVVLLFQIGQPAAYGLDHNVYDISPNSWPGFWDKSRAEQERLLVSELEARLSVKIRRAARGRLAWNGTIAMAAVATVALAYHWDLHGSALATWYEWRGDAIAMAKQHIRNDLHEVYEFIQKVNNGQETGQTIDEDHLVDFFKDGFKPHRLLTSRGHECIEFIRKASDGDGQESLVIPKNYWPGLVDTLRHMIPDFPTHYKFPRQLSTAGGVLNGAGRIAEAAVSTPSSLSAVDLGTMFVRDTIVHSAGTLARRVAATRFVAHPEAPVKIEAVADALRQRQLTAKLADGARKALATVAAVGAIWNWKEVLSVGSLLTIAVTGIYDRVMIPVLPHLYAAGSYAARFPGMMCNDLALAFYHVTFSELIDDERAYIKLRHFMYPPLVERVDQVLADAHDGKISADQACQFVRYAMRMPLTERYERYERQRIGDRFGEFFNYYSQNTQQVFRGILEDALAENILVDDSLRIGVARSSTLNRHTFLHGPQGVGKTYGVSGFAEIIDRPLSKMQLHASDHLQNEGIAFGLDGASPGRIAMGLMRATSDSSYHTLWSVALYDEADTSLNNPELVEFWKGALDPNSAGIYLPYFGVTFPWPHNVFFLGNTEIQDPALLSRLDVAQLDPYTQAQKRAILTDRLVPRLLRNDFNTVDFQAGTIRDEAGHEESYQFFNLPDGLQRELLELLEKYRQDPGMRGIEAAAKRALGRHRLYHIY